MTLVCSVMAWGENVAIAQIGETTYYKGDEADAENHIYTTAQLALNATVADVENGGTIKLLSGLTAEFFNLTAADPQKTITIDLNGKTLTRNNTIITVNSGNKLILVNTDSNNNGCINHTGNNLSYAIWCKANAEVEINNGVTVQSEKSNSIKGASGATITINGGTLTYAGTNTMAVIGAVGSTLNINGGSIIGNPNAGNTTGLAIQAKTSSTVNMTGGTITAGNNKDNTVAGAEAASSVYLQASTLTMTGGEIRSTTTNPALYVDGFSNVAISGTVPTIASTSGDIVLNNGATVNNVIAKSSTNLTINEGATVSSTSGYAIKAEAVGEAIPSIIINGGTINYVGSVNSDVILCNGATLTMNDGTIENPTSWYAIYAQNGAQVTINGGVLRNTSSSSSAVVIDLLGNKTPGGDSIKTTVNINGGSIMCQAGDGVDIFGKGATLNITGGVINALNYGISGNGSITADKDYSGTTINISGGTIGSSETRAAIYHPQTGKLKISGNPVFMGRSGIQLCSGVGMTGSITGGRFEACGTDSRATKKGDGYIDDGAALSVVNRDYPGGTPRFTIKGGVFLAQHQDAVLAYTWSSNTASEWPGSVNFLSIQEGIFSSDPTTYVPAYDYTVTKLDPTPTVYNHDEVVYNDLWQVGEASHEQSYDFTEAEAEYVKINATTAEESANIEGTTYTLAEDQSSKKVEVAGGYTLIIKEDKTLNIGNGGLDLNAGSQVVVEPGAVVTVGTNGITSASGTDNLVLEANSEKQAVLLIDPDVIQNTQPLATVILSTKARQKSANPWNYIWEYFASPVAEITPSTKPTNNFNSGVHGLFADETEFVTGVYTWGGNDWALVNSWTNLVPFKGYQLTNNSAYGGVEYTFKGNLLGNEDGEYAFTSNGYGYFGNSYSAPIVISNFLSALDNAVYERTVWLYDAGADTYVSVNPLAARLGSAKYKDGTAIKEIRSLQAFILNKKADGANAPINYRDAIWNNPRINSLVSAAPAREQANDMQWTNIYVEANGNKELVTLVEGADFSNEFDNGADAGKYINNNSMNLYAATNDGEQAIVATDNLENTLISFQAGNATEYTLSFENGNEDYMLRDNVTGQTIAMIEGAEYTFTQTANTTAQARFEVIAIAKMPTSIENVEEAAKATGIYTITGQYMGRDFTKLPAGVYVVNGVKIVK